MNELSSYVFSPLREGDSALYRGSGNGLAPILLVAVEETSLGCVEPAVTLGAQFGSALLLMITAPHEAMRSVAPSRLRSDVFSVTTVFL